MVLLLAAFRGSLEEGEGERERERKRYVNYMVLTSTLPTSPLLLDSSLVVVHLSSSQLAPLSPQHFT